jgi:2-polyprenyl-6-hydroxyphenyl methylase/3-demethylubiquinone-9 3-methyltransferase
MPDDKLKRVESHFAFGKNWHSYSSLIDQERIDEAIKGLLHLIPAEAFRGRSFLDIGCGSGLHALAAAGLGVKCVTAIDLDPDSVVTARAVLARGGVSVPWSVDAASVFDLDPKERGTFDIVYSWGVLHHTGSMWEAIAKAAAMVAPGGLLVLALYRRTRLDAFWRTEKRFYALAPRFVQRAIAASYVMAFRLAMLAGGRSFAAYTANYKSSRGMDFRHDVHDWLGGYPYESVLAGEVEQRLGALGFAAERVFAMSSGPTFKFGCDEYVYRNQRSGES